MFLFYWFIWGANVSRGTLKKDQLSKNKVFLNCKDYTVSNERFDLVLDESLEMLITTPQPSLANLGKYYQSESYISHTDSKQSLFDKLYQFVKTITIKKKVKLLSKESDVSSSEKTLLDVGCGTGDFLVACKNKQWKITGVEPNMKAKETAELKLKETIVSDFSEIKSQTFDCITMWHVLEHIPDLTNYIASLKKILKPKGTLFIAVPNYKSYDAQFYKEFWAAYDVPRHLWHFSKKSISLLFKKEKMKVVKQLPMKFDSYYVSLLSEKYKRGRSNPIRAFWTGFRSNSLAKHTKEYSSIIYVIKNE